MDMAKPTIRFKGYQDDWEQRKLGDVVEDYVEKTTVEDQYPVLTSSQRKGIVLQDDFFAGDRVNQNGNIGYFIIPRGYFAFRSRSDNDVFVFNRNDAVDMGIISYFYPVFKPRGVDSDFLLRRLNYGLEDQIKINSEGTGQHVLSLKKFKNMIGLFPSYEEQKKIGSYFSQIDHLITLHQRKCDETKRLKKYMLQKMFPQNGEKVPEIRFSGFTDDWEQRKLGDIGKARSGVGFPDAEQGGVTGIPFFKVSDMNLDGNENEMTVANNYVTAEQIAVHRWSPITELPAIFFAKVGAAVMLNRKRLCRFPFLLDNNTMAYSLGSTKWDADFAKALFGTVDLTSLVQVGALPSYNAGDVESMEIYLPSLLEQEQLGGFFKQLDTLITLHQRECISFTARAGRLILTANKKRNTSSWEQRKFSDITFPAGEKNKDNLPLESYSITNEHGFVPQDEKFENGGTMREADKRMYYIVSPNSFAYNPARINVGSIGYQNIGKNVIVSSLYEVFKTSEDVDDRLLWHWFKSPDFQKLIMQLQEGGVRLYFYYDKLCMGEVSLPSLEEQRKIGKLFDTLDNLITLHQRKPFLMKWRTSDANRNQTNRLVL